MRNLAHIETIDWISPIEGKDRIVLAESSAGLSSFRKQTSQSAIRSYSAK